ncbi:MAG: prolyl oligopeptidase family serine peptidase, partial [Flammeovirgaceae bacterium]
MTMNKLYSLCILLFGILFNSTAQQVENQSTLTIDQIMEGEKFVGYVPQNINWSEDGHTIYFQWNPEGEALRSWYKVDKTGGTPQKVSDEEWMELPAFNGVYSQDFSKKVYTKYGDLFVLDRSTNTKIQVTNTLAREFNGTFSSDEQFVFYQQGNNLFAWSVADGSTKQLTNFQKGTAPSEKNMAAYKEWLNNDQLTYFEVLKDRKATNELRKARADKRKMKRPRAIYLSGNSLSNVRISPNGRFVSYKLTKRSKAKRTKVPNFVTESGYLEDINARMKVGTPQDTYEFWVYDCEKDSTYQVDVKQLEGIYDKPKFKEDYHTGDDAYNDQYEQPREVNVHGPVYSSDGKALVDIRAMDNKDRWVAVLDLATGTLEVIERQHDDAWIGGPGISGWNFVMGNMGWLPDNETIWFQSEETGYSHLFIKNINTKKEQALTSGAFEVLSVRLSRDKTDFYLTTNEVSPHEHHFYKMSVKGGKRQQLTDGVGNHEVTLSPDETHMAVRFSYSNTPWELFVKPTKKGGKAKQLTTSTRKSFQAYTWKDPEVVRFKAEDGAEVPARLYKPKNPNGAAVIFVHGAGYLQNVHKWWSVYYREYMFHNILADNGYTVLDIDYRASNGYGRDWRTAIYRHMGGKDLSDQVDGAKYLVAEHGIDQNRIGIYGGSYGGFITLMAMFKAPETFKAGAALRSVTDWAHYNHPYTSNILNTPVEDSIAYYKSSPIYHAEGLKGNLVILHGMVDSNVQFQDVVRLSQRLIELKKENWEMAVFPMEGHGFREPSS